MKVEWLILICEELVLSDFLHFCSLSASPIQIKACWIHLSHGWEVSGPGAEWIPLGFSLSLSGPQNLLQVTPLTGPAFHPWCFDWSECIL